MRIFIMCQVLAYKYKLKWSLLSKALAKAKMKTKLLFFSFHVKNQICCNTSSDTQTLYIVLTALICI